MTIKINDLHQHTTEEGKTVWIKTSFIYPPIPIRTHDWVAWYDSLGEDGSPYGYGEAEATAILDLTTNYPPEDYLPKDYLP